jgi:hypothetical protein
MVSGGLDRGQGRHGSTAQLDIIDIYKHGGTAVVPYWYVPVTCTEVRGYLL